MYCVCQLYSVLLLTTNAFLSHHPLGHFSSNIVLIFQMQNQSLWFLLTLSTCWYLVKPCWVSWSTALAIQPACFAISCEFISCQRICLGHFSHQKVCLTVRCTSFIQCAVSVLRLFVICSCSSAICPAFMPPQTHICCLHFWPPFVQQPLVYFATALVDNIVGFFYLI